MLLFLKKIRIVLLLSLHSYPCVWGGVVDGKPMVAGLEEFASRALNNLWNGIQKLFPLDSMVCSLSFPTI